MNTSRMQEWRASHGRRVPEPAAARATRGESPTPDEPSARRVGRRVAELAAMVALGVLAVLVGPGLGGLRRHMARASPGWLAAAVGLEALSALSYVVVFRAVFCPRMRS